MRYIRIYFISYHCFVKYELAEEKRELYTNKRFTLSVFILRAQLEKKFMYTAKITAFRIGSKTRYKYYKYKPINQSCFFTHLYYKI